MKRCRAVGEDFIYWTKTTSQIEKAAGFVPTAFTNLAPQVGLEPTTLRLTAECSAIELLRNTVAHGPKSAVRE
jgi:hypothetical protein